MYFAGWEDIQEGYTQILSNNYEVVYSPYKLFYENTLRAKHKDNDNKASYFLSAIFINHVVSMLDILFSIKNDKVSMSPKMNLFSKTNNNIFEGINISVGIK